MDIYADLRCLQDDNYAFRGVGYHSSVLLNCSRNFLSRTTRLIGLVDPSLNRIPDVYSALVDETQSVFAPRRPSEQSIFIQFSPMTHEPEKTARLVGHPNILSCAVVYDFIPLDLPERYLANGHAARDYAAQLGWLGAFDLFFPISQCTALRLQNIFPIAASAIEVTGVALRPAFEKIMRNAAKPILADKPVGQPYVLFVGGADRRKNVEVLIAAHSKLKSECDLVIVGDYPAQDVARLRAAYCACGGSLSQLKFLSGISDEQLGALYRHAQCSVCCSEIEGFSLPVLEAVACGNPILVSDNQAHRELIQCERAFFSPNDEQGLTSLLSSVLSDPNLRAAILAQQSAMPSQFVGEKVGERFWVPILSMAQKRSRPRFHRSTARNARGRPRIAILTPFPPDASGVADYTRRSLQALGKYADIDVFTDADNPLPTTEVQNFFPISKYPYVSGEFDSVLTVVGNSHFHTKIIQLQCEFGGPCLIHDNRLAEVYNWWKGPEHLALMATRSLGRRVSIPEVQHWISNPGSLPSVFFDELIPCSVPLIVHSRGLQSQCRREYGIEAAYLPFCCYRDFPAADLTPEARFESKKFLGIPADQVVIVCLGIVSPTKAPIACIEAIEKLNLAGVPAHLYFVGSAGSMQPDLEAHASKLGIENRVHLTQDWIGETQYYRYVQAADFAIQLRNHYFGGLSGAMLDCISSGLVTVANEDLAEALESPQSVLRISDELKADDVFCQLHTAYCHRKHLDRLTPARVQYLRDHSFERYALELLDVLGLAIPNGCIHPQIGALATPTAFEEVDLISQH